MRTQVRLYCPFSRDLSWITQEIIEDYAGSKLRGGDAPSYCISKWTAGDQSRSLVMAELLDPHPDLTILMAELEDEFGIEYFAGKPKSKQWHIIQIENAIAIAKTASDRAALYKELREYQGWSSKPVDKAPDITVINNNNVALTGDKSNIERMYMSIMG